MRQAINTTAPIDTIVGAMQKVNANFAELYDLAWITLPECTYVSATSFTVSGNYNGIISKGTKIYLNQSGSKYFYASATSYNAGTDLTTVTIYENADYTLTSAAITVPRFSNAANPSGWPGMLNWTPTIGGFSSNPASGVYQYLFTGNMCKCFIRQPNNGTSNANTLTITGPATAITLTSGLWNNFCQAIDNGTSLYGNCNISSASNIINFYKAAASGAWTTSGNKSVSFATLEYPAA
jgi:hypothetical protein